MMPATCRSRALPFPSSPLLFLSSSSLHLFTSASHPLHHHHHHHCSRSSINSINPSLPSPLLSLPLAEVCPSIAHGPASSLLTELAPARRNALHTCNLLPLPLALSLPSSLPPRFFFHCFQQPGNGTLAIVFSAALTCAPPTAFYSRSTVSIDRFDTSSQPARQPAPFPFSRSHEASYDRRLLFFLVLNLLLLRPVSSPSIFFRVLEMPAIS